LESGIHLERVRIKIFDNPANLSANVSDYIAGLIKTRRKEGLNLVLGLPTGSTPIGVYKRLIDLHKNEGLDLSNVITFNLDEYYPMEPDTLQSYRRFMFENFFDHVNIPDAQIHIPSGQVSRSNINQHCE
ncbi:unnamed protein product, partial [Laminaria digitata]